MSEKPELITQNRISLFWIRENDTHISTKWLEDFVGIKRLMWRSGEGKQRIIFHCDLPDATEFIRHMADGKIAVHYTPEGRVGNPWLGEVLATIKITEDYDPDVWINDLKPLYFSGGPVSIHIQAECIVELNNGLPFPKFKSLLGE
jgi:hypothetical protein